MKRIYIVCNLLIIIVIAVFVVKTISTYIYFQKNPEQLMVMSAPWYIGLVIPFYITVAIVFILIVVQVLYKKR